MYSEDIDAIKKIVDGFNTLSSNWSCDPIKFEVIKDFEVCLECPSISVAIWIGDFLNSAGIQLISVYGKKVYIQ